MIATQQARFLTSLEIAQFCPFCEAVVDHTGCDCGEFLPTYDLADNQVVLFEEAEDDAVLEVHLSL